MQCTLLRELEVYEPNAPADLVARCVRRGVGLFAPVGTLLDDPDCWRIVLMGQADAADDECRERTVQTPEQREATLQAAKRLAAGIHPDDFAAFDAGEMTGYHANGTPIPGPNAKHVEEDEEET